jgi:hypothetical protein
VTATTISLSLSESTRPQATDSLLSDLMRLQLHQESPVAEAHVYLRLLGVKSTLLLLHSRACFLAPVQHMH